MRDAFGVPTHGSSVLDLALTNCPALFSLFVNAIPIVSDHAPLTVECAVSQYAPLPQPITWDVNQADWEGYAASAAVLFADLENELAHCIASASPATALLKVNEMTRKLTVCFDLAAVDHVPRTAYTPPQLHKPKLVVLLHSYAILDRACKRLRHRINTLTKRGKDTTHYTAKLNASQGPLRAARAKWQTASNALMEQDWRDLCRSVEGVSKQVAWRRWHRTLPSSNMPLNSITLSSADPLPASMSHSLDALGRYYRTVYSSSPIPEWDANAPARAPAARPSRVVKESMERIDQCLSLDLMREPGSLDHRFTASEVQRSCAQAKHTAAGPDGLPAEFLRKAPAVVHRCLAAIFNFSWHHGVIPSVGNRPTRFACSRRVRARILLRTASSPSPVW